MMPLVIELIECLSLEIPRDQALDAAPQRWLPVGQANAVDVASRLLSRRELAGRLAGVG